MYMIHFNFLSALDSNQEGDHEQFPQEMATISCNYQNNSQAQGVV